MLETINLSCARGDRPLFAGLSFVLRPGAALHVAGENGTGKTTLLRCLAGLTRPVAGQLRYGGEDIPDGRERYLSDLSFLGHANGLKGELTARENLVTARHLAGGGLVGNTGAGSGIGLDRALATMSLDHPRHLPARFLSQGQARRAALARLPLLGRPLWILDEPYSGLDIRACDTLTTLLRQHNERGGMLVITSHQPLDLPHLQRLTLGTA